MEITITDTGSARMAEQVRGGDLDLAFVGLFADQVPADLVHRLLAAEPLVGIVALDHPLALAGEIRLAELADDTAFVEMRAESGLRRQVDAAFDRGRRCTAGSPSSSVPPSLSSGSSPWVSGPRSSRCRPPRAGTDVGGARLLDITTRHPTSVVHRFPAPSAPSARAFLALLGSPDE